MDRELNQINVIPLVDVMLVLLVIVLTTATFITTGQIPVELAKAATAAPREAVPVTITLTQSGQLFLNDQPVPAGGLLDMLGSYQRDSSVVVRADRQARLDPFVDVVDTVRGLGFHHVSLDVIRL